MAASGQLEKEKTADRGPDFFTRFSINQRVQHIILMVSFIILAVTGLAQRYYAVGWAEWVILGLGGIEYTRLVHRFFGLIFTLIIFYHLGYLVYVLFVKHSRPTMIPTLKDFRDAVTVLKYSLGFAEKPPKFDRFDYNQKFEYWGLVFGGMVIIVSGFVLAFPLAITRVLPGQVVAAAVDFHGFEATLAVLTIIIWHLYDVIFKPGIFPADTSIFTGKISKERMLHEHPLEYAELTGTDVTSGNDQTLPDESTSEQSPA